MNAPKREVEFDNLSLEGLEDLLDRIFEPAMQPGSTGHLSSPANDPAQICYALPASIALDDEELLSDAEKIECLYNAEGDQSVPANHRRKANVRVRALNEVEVLSNKLKLFRSQLQFALSELERVKKSEASLRLRLTVTQDRLRSQSTILDPDEDIAGDALAICE